MLSSDKNCGHDPFKPVEFFLHCYVNCVQLPVNYNPLLTAPRNREELKHERVHIYKSVMHEYFLMVVLDCNVRISSLT